eukprot:3852585-Prymnesium_polylepis.1
MADCEWPTVNGRFHWVAGLSERWAETDDDEVSLGGSVCGASGRRSWRAVGGSCDRGVSGGDSCSECTTAADGASTAERSPSLPFTTPAARPFSPRFGFAAGGRDPRAARQKACRALEAQAKFALTLRVLGVSALGGEQVSARLAPDSEHDRLRTRASRTARPPLRPRGHRCGTA